MMFYSFDLHQAAVFGIKDSMRSLFREQWHRILEPNARGHYDLIFFTGYVHARADVPCNILREQSAKSG